MEEVYIYDSLRTPFGKGNEQGALFEVRPVDLLSQCLKAIQRRNELPTELVEDFLIGCVMPMGGQADNIAKTALLLANWSVATPGMQINRFQASGLESIALAATKIKSGWNSLVVAGGIESMSRIQRANNLGAIFSDPDMLNRMGAIPNGVAADLLATIKKLDKQQLDNFAFQSLRKAQKALDEPVLQRSVIPIYDQNGIVILDKDETVDTTESEETIALAVPIFSKANRVGYDAIALRKYPLVEKINPVHSQKNIASTADSAALMLLGNPSLQRQLGRKPRAIIRYIYTTSTELTLTHLGGIAATKTALAKAKLTAKDIDLWYVNESFAAPALLFQRKFEIPEERFNPCGGNIAFGESLGANGTVLLGKLLDELERQQLHRGLVAISAETGIGGCMIIERI
ncbi:MAG: acetyl-CoA C-acyltransferase [Bacteroidota bacterium]